MENREIFMQAGGEHFHYIPALNDQDIHIQTLATIAESHLTGWKVTKNNAPEEREKQYRSHTHNQKS